MQSWHGHLWPCSHGLQARTASVFDRFAEQGLEFFELFV